MRYSKNLSTMAHAYRDVLDQLDGSTWCMNASIGQAEEVVSGHLREDFYILADCKIVSGFEFLIVNHPSGGLDWAGESQAWDARFHEVGADDLASNVNEGSGQGFTAVRACENAILDGLAKGVLAMERIAEAAQSQALRQLLEAWKLRGNPPYGNTP